MVIRLSPRSTMVSSLQLPPAKERRACAADSSGQGRSSAGKRKREEDEGTDHRKTADDPNKELKLWNDPANLGIAAADDPLPPEWRQRCLNIKSGKIHFFDTRTSGGRREGGEEEAQGAAPRRGSSPLVSLDLDLNLMSAETSPGSCSHGGGGGPGEKQDEQEDSVAVAASDGDRHTARGRPLCKAPPPWVSSGDEMVATVCGRCHMLVVMCKSSPSCPSCKFRHPPEQISPPSSAAVVNHGAQALVL